MKELKITQENYACSVVRLNKFIQIPSRDRIKHTVIQGNLVIVGVNCNEGQLGLYFPVECRMSESFVKYNNLYRDSSLNIDITKKGYIESNRRVKCLPLAGVESVGLFIPLDDVNLSFLPDFDKSTLTEGDTFNFINDELICSKYVVLNTLKSNNSNEPKKVKFKEPIVIDTQFRFHQDTSHLGKNIHSIKPTDIISITRKLHGTSGISANVLIKKKLTLAERFIKFIQKLFKI